MMLRDAIDKASGHGSYMRKTMEMYGKMISEPKIAIEQCAKTIFEAATDGSSKLRYFVGDDYRGFLKARYETSSDEEYVAYMRNFCN